MSGELTVSSSSSDSDTSESSEISASSSSSSSSGDFMAASGLCCAVLAVRGGD